MEKLEVVGRDLGILRSFVMVALRLQPKRTGCQGPSNALFVSKGVLIGIDPVPRMLEITRELTAAQTAGDRIEFQLGSAEKPPIDDDFADFIFAFDSFDHWHDKKRGLKEVRRVLIRDGRFVVVKDFDLPDAKDGGLDLVGILTRSDFVFMSERFIEAEGVSFTSCRIPSLQ